EQELNDIIRNKLNQEEGEDVMRTIADVYIEKGIEIGLQRGAEQVKTIADVYIEKGMEKGIEKGREEGMEKGITIGIEKGALQRDIQIVQNLLSKGADLDFIADVTSLPKERVAQLSMVAASV